VISSNKLDIDQITRNKQHIIVEEIYGLNETHNEENSSKLVLNKNNKNQYLIKKLDFN
jgi:hypothetical protein